jgi:hypothetical protein
MGGRILQRHMLYPGELKGDLSIRPIHRQLEERIKAHISISFLYYCLQAGVPGDISRVYEDSRIFSVFMLYAVNNHCHVSPTLHATPAGTASATTDRHHPCNSDTFILAPDKEHFHINKLPSNLMPKRTFRCLRQHPYRETSCRHRASQCIQPII